MKQINYTDAQLTELWNRRSVLNESEWAELYRIVNAALRKRNYKINSYLKSLANEEEDYINEFFSTKVMATADNSASHREVTAQHLRGFFANFLYDQLEKEQRELSNLLTQTSIDDDGGGDENNEGYQSNKPLKDSREYNFSPDTVEETLIHHGMTRRQCSARLVAKRERLLGYGAVDRRCTTVLRAMDPGAQYATARFGLVGSRRNAVAASARLAFRKNTFQPRQICRRVAFDGRQALAVY